MGSIAYLLGGAAVAVAVAYGVVLSETRPTAYKAQNAIAEIFRQDPKQVSLRQDQFGNTCAEYYKKTFVLKPHQAQSNDGINSLIARHSEGRATPTGQIVFRSINGLKDSGLSEGNTYWVPLTPRENECNSQ